MRIAFAILFGLAGAFLLLFAGFYQRYVVSRLGEHFESHGGRSAKREVFEKLLGSKGFTILLRAIGGLFVAFAILSLTQ